MQAGILALLDQATQNSGAAASVEGSRPCEGRCPRRTQPTEPKPNDKGKPSIAPNPVRPGPACPARIAMAEMNRLLKNVWGEREHQREQCSSCRSKNSCPSDLIRSYFKRLAEGRGGSKEIPKEKKNHRGERTTQTRRTRRKEEEEDVSETTKDTNGDRKGRIGWTPFSATYPLLRRHPFRVFRVFRGSSSPPVSSVPPWFLPPCSAFFLSTFSFLPFSG